MKLLCMNDFLCLLMVVVDIALLMLQKSFHIWPPRLWLAGLSRTRWTICVGALASPGQKYLGGHSSLSHPWVLGLPLEFVTTFP